MSKMSRPPSLRKARRRLRFAETESMYVRHAFIRYGPARRNSRGRDLRLGRRAELPQTRGSGGGPGCAGPPAGSEFVRGDSGRRDSALRLGPGYTLRVVGDVSVA